MENEKNDIRAARYVIRVKNHLDARWEHWFEGMTITQIENGEMLLSGEVVDQSALHGLLEKIRNLNLTLISCQKMDEDMDH
jgi:hypothetical protein